MPASTARRTGRSVFDDIVNKTAPEFEKADGLAVAAPVYYGSANSILAAFLTQHFYSTPFDKTMKVGCAIGVARRGDLSSTYDELNKFFAISGMPIAAGQYWNGVHRREKDEVKEDS